MPASSPDAEARAAARGRDGFARDLATYGGATAIATVLGLAQVFIVPKLLDVASFGRYRIFLLYVGQAGLLHLGLADGALLRWSHLTPPAISAEWRQWRWRLLLLQVAFAAVVAAIALFTTGETRVLTLVLALALPVVNLLTLASNALQTSRAFRSAGIVLIAPSIVFVAALPFIPAASRSAGMVCLLWTATEALALLLCVWRLSGVRATESESGSEKAGASWRSLLNVGVPILTANLAAGLGLSLDRFLVSWSRPVGDFALYGFAGSALFLASSATQAVARVAIPHSGPLAATERRALFGRVARLVIVAYAAALAGYPLFEWIVPAWLPNYVSALPIVRAMLLGVPFWFVMQSVLVVSMQVAGVERVAMWLQLLGATLLGVSTGLPLWLGMPLWVVALGASIASVVTWAVASATWRRTDGTASDAGTAVWGATSLVLWGAMILACNVSEGVWARTGLYLLVALPIVGWRLRTARA